MKRKTHTLLVIDSSASHRFYLGTMLRRLEYIVRSVPSAEDAMKAMKEELPSLVIIDYALSGMNGIELLSRMKKDQRLKAIPAIMQSDEDAPGMREQCMAAGCIAYFKKPADIEALYEVIQFGLEPSPRKTIRIETAFRVEISHELVPNSAVRQEYVTALSDGGLYIRTITPEPVNTAFTLKLFILDRVITATGISLYSTRQYGGESGGPGMGLKFVTISNSDKAFIRDYIKKRVSQGLSF